ncbi:hypothetical protein MPY17_39525 (plasmid) [Rhodococcus opacus]|uniref:hypothetical protein n=1 Tax=Rhodococcus opacus TaxID=37919 RepID=UPI001FF67AC6|nr:hypothetical protein [Rhodococcus opacus]UOT08490.1 hypothetical protein MPY17_39525 [Rhodococcus opacus]
MSIDHHGQHPGDSELALDTTETAILDTFLRALALHALTEADPADTGPHTIGRDSMNTSRPPVRALK